MELLDLAFQVPDRLLESLVPGSSLGLWNPRRHSVADGVRSALVGLDAARSVDADQVGRVLRKVSFVDVLMVPHLNPEEQLSWQIKGIIEELQWKLGT